jgi:hypothetical protein
MKRAWLIAVVAAILVAGGAYLISRNNAEEAPADNTLQMAIQEEAPPPAPTAQFTQEKFENIKSAHYVSSDPANNQLLTAPTPSVTIKFNFVLADNSQIDVKRNGASVAAGPVQYAADKLSMTLPIDGSSTGNYAVTYTACWPDRSCHDGSFGFSIQLP